MSHLYRFIQKRNGTLSAQWQVAQHTFKILMLFFSLLSPPRAKAALLLTIYLLLYVVSVVSIFPEHKLGGFMCPFACNGHGACLRNHTCACYSGFSGPDCSYHTCPLGISWASKAYEMDQSHSSMECSGNGLCNIKNGKCQCFAGYTGTACEKSTCGNDVCNNHGQCLTISTQYDLFRADRSDSGNYTLWEHSSTTSCVCEPGYTGPYCEIRE